MRGYVAVHRKLFEHWLWEKGRPLTRCEAWLYIISSVNYADAKCLIQGTLYTCKRGQALYSIGEWAKKFNWSTKKVKVFFDLLKREGMINTKGLKYTTLLTVCNYDTYNNLGITEVQLGNNSGITQGKSKGKLKNSSGLQEEKNKEIKKNKEEEEIAPLTLDLICYIDNVYMRREDFERLGSIYGRGEVWKTIERCEDWKKSEGVKKVRNDGITIERWLKEDANKPAPPADSVINAPKSTADVEY